GTTGLTINAGLRFDHEHNPAFDPTRFPDINFGWGQKIAPRIGGAYDLLHNGTVKLYASWGKFFDIMKLGLTRGSFGSDYWHECIYALHAEPPRKHHRGYVDYRRSRLLYRQSGDKVRGCPAPSGRHWEQPDHHSLLCRVSGCRATPAPLRRRRVPPDSQRRRSLVWHCQLHIQQTAWELFRSRGHRPAGCKRWAP